MPSRPHASFSCVDRFLLRKSYSRVGIDLTPHGVPMANVGWDGSPENWPEGLAERLRAEAAVSLHKYAGQLQAGVAPGRIGLHAPEMGQGDTDRRTFLVLAWWRKLVVGKPPVREDLGIRQGARHQRRLQPLQPQLPL